MAAAPFTQTLSWLWGGAASTEIGKPVVEVNVDAAAPEVAFVAAPMLRDDAVPVALVPPEAEVRVSAPVCATPTKAQLATTLPAPMPDVSIALWRPARKEAAPSEPEA